MKLVLKILVYLLLQSSSIYLLCGQNDCQNQINDLEVKKNKLTTERRVSLNQLKQGKYCSQCNRSAIEIEKSGVNFKQHLIDVNGKEIPAPEELIRQKAEEYNQKIKDLNDQIFSIKLNCNQNTPIQILNNDNNTTFNNSDNSSDNIFNDGQNNQPDTSAMSRLPEDLLDLINKNKTDSILCAQCKELAYYRDIQLIMDYDMASKNYEKLSEDIKKIKEIIQNLKDCADKVFKKSSDSKFPVPAGDGGNAYRAGYNLQVEYSYLLVKYENELLIAYKIIETFLPIIIPPSIIVFATIDISASIITGDNIAKAIAMGVTSVCLNKITNIKESMMLTIEIAKNLKQAYGVYDDIKSVASNVEDIKNKNEKTKNSIIGLNQNLDALVGQLSSLETQLNEAKNNLSIINKVKEAIDEKCGNIKCE